MCTLCRVSGLAYLVNSPVVRSVRRRGYVNSGAVAGLRYFNAHNAPANANWNYGAGLNPSPGFHADADAVSCVMQSHVNFLCTPFSKVHKNRNTLNWNGLVSD